MVTRADKVKAFRGMHQAVRGFIVANPWDVGSARLLAGLGFGALATTSAGFANSEGGADYTLTRETVIDHCRKLCESVDVPLSADLENGFGDTPDACAETVRLGAEAGLAGGSIEDFTGIATPRQYEIQVAKTRIEASVEAAKAVEGGFVLTARAENFFTGEPDLDDTIARLQVYQEAGADVLYAPGLRTMEDIKSVLYNVDRPLNVLLGPFEGFVPLSDVLDLGVARISLGPALSNAAYGALHIAAKALLSEGDLGFLASAIDSDLRDKLLMTGAASHSQS